MRGRRAGSLDGSCRRWAALCRLLMKRGPAIRCRRPSRNPGTHQNSKNEFLTNETLRTRDRRCDHAERKLDGRLLFEEIRNGVNKTSTGPLLCATSTPTVYTSTLRQTLQLRQPHWKHPHYHRCGMIAHQYHQCS